MNQLSNASATAFGINPRHEALGILDFTAMFGNDLPVIVEIGSGKGRFLLESARLDPARNYTGIEKSLHYYRVILSRLERACLPNARIINFDAFAILRDSVKSKSIAEIHIYFPDPWPRKREQKRRMIRPEVVEQMNRVLADDGFGRYVTDHKEYFEAARPVLESVFKVTEQAGDRPPRTNYEAKYREQGRPIYEVTFRK
ncbi:MAG TPA: tRNA (guanosine(46)-N7)-methyltransferase TrmB [Thermoanaerobaculia bacterium]|nr:tRNA (guanosine(46)-N7)-methyltransferase TrmB [Thermoanaerobaculia bacterium]